MRFSHAEAERHAAVLRTALVPEGKGTGSASEDRPRSASHVFHWRQSLRCGHREFQRTAGKARGRQRTEDIHRNVRAQGLD